VRKSTTGRCPTQQGKKVNGQSYVGNFRGGVASSLTRPNRLSASDTRALVTTKKKFINALNEEEVVKEKKRETCTNRRGQGSIVQGK